MGVSIQLSSVISRISPDLESVLRYFWHDNNVCCDGLLYFIEFSLTHVDEVIDELLTKDYSCDIAMPRIKKRYCVDLLSVFSYSVIVQVSHL